MPAPGLVLPKYVAVVMKLVAGYLSCLPPITLLNPTGVWEYDAGPGPNFAFLDIRSISLFLGHFLKAPEANDHFIGTAVSAADGKPLDSLCYSVKLFLFSFPNLYPVIL